ncbi:hypothetical protein R3P38DRAFT_3212724 [Favolaschia claudopus]|uniref:Uncharacterized protein n=1 Tax=Favolaschia claudopus TaxID=2862362 RepID=A0AAW0ACY7_9AGAR
MTNWGYQPVADLLLAGGPISITPAVDSNSAGRTGDGAVRCKQGDAAGDRISLPEILRTANGLQALAKFSEKTGAFTKTGKPRDTVEPVEMRDDENYQFGDKEAGSEGGGGEEEPEGSVDSDDED